MTMATAIVTATKLIPPPRRRASTRMSSPRSVELPPAKLKSSASRLSHLGPNLADLTPLTQPCHPYPRSGQEGKLFLDSEMS
ncbi:hypothetical protein TIFTF001_024567 [Ficus carica]|uniref:Uncharacterized protein n=1 Tax=Ficus carica TaxID=3494 RepID=A0AA88AM97_FICCA|nr:hypothetical protein TIFTF001_024567 [Ficus carica]